MTNATTLRVLANPFAALDHLGRPAGACPCDPVGHTPDRRWVGARLHARTALEESLRREEGSLRTPAQNTEFDFARDAQVTPLTSYYLDRVRDGDLLAADEACARAAGIPFLPPAEALARAKARAVASWVAHYGSEPSAAVAFWRSEES